MELNAHYPKPAAVQDLDALVRQLPEPELWSLLQDISGREIGLRDETIRQLDDRMQGFLFLQDHVVARSARIDFARSTRHMSYLRDAAGSRNVWMSDQEFSELVAEDDSITLACFARSEEMQPHHLMYIGHKLAAHPHRDELLATTDDTRITLTKVLETHGNTRELALMRLAMAALQGSDDLDSVFARRVPGAVVDSNGDPRSLWRAYLNLKNLDESTLRELLEAAQLSTARPVGTSGSGAGSLH